MPRLPQPGSDHGTWGDVLNDFLSQALAANGQLKPDSVGTPQLKDNAVTAATLAPNSVTSAALASNAVTAAIIADGSITEALLDTALQTKVNAGQSGLNTKLDKIATTNQVYVTDGSGNQSSRGFSINPVSNTIAQRTVDGAITATQPTASNHVATKQYVDTADSARVLGPDGVTDNVIARFDGTTGKVVKGSGVSISNNNEIGVNKPSASGYSVSVDKPMEVVSTLPMGYETTIYGQAGQNVFKRANGTSGSPVAVVNGDSLGSFSFRGYNGTAFTGSKAYIYAMASQDWSDTANGTNVTVQTTPNNSTTLQTTAIFTATGQMRLPVTGGAAGLLIGGDTNLYRYSADILSTDDRLLLNVPTNAIAFSVRSFGAGDNNDRFQINGAGALLMGAGNAFPDTNLYRSTADMLKTDDSFHVSGNLGVGTAPTHPLTLSSTAGASGVAIYNSADQTTNYERARHYWSGNVYTIGTEFGGTGVARNMELKANGVAFRIRAGGSPAGLWEFASGLTSANNVGVNISGSYTASSGVNPIMAIQPTINQTAAAGYTALLVNPTETATGSGTKLLADFQVGGSSKARIDTSGVITAAAGTATGSVVTVDGAQTLTNKTINGLNLSGNMTLPQSSTFQLFNTADQATNYERLMADFVSNTARVYTAFGGTAASRNISLGVVATANSSAVTTNVTVSAGAPFFRFNRSSSTTNAPFADFGGLNTSANSGMATILSINPVINQSSTAGYTALLVNPTETATGSGTKLLADFQVGGSSKARIDTSGVITAVAGTGAGSVATVDGAQTLSGKTISFASNTITGSPYDVLGFVQTLATRAVGAGDNTIGIRLARACTFTSVTFRCVTADASGSLVVELRKNGAQVSGTSTTIAAANQVAGATTTGSWSFAAGDVLTVHVTAVGTTPGRGLVADITGVTA